MSKEEPPPPSGAPTFDVGNVGPNARVAIGENITWIEATAPAPAALYQLPPDIADFTDREAALAQLREPWLDPTRVRLWSRRSRASPGWVSRLGPPSGPRALRRLS